eukprot:m.103085 g.103085  ORF g.103085 m.103085 type:complete len:79 (+) comp15556_c0_seq5:1371-1607(+)
MAQSEASVTLTVLTQLAKVVRLSTTRAPQCLPPAWLHQQLFSARDHELFSITRASNDEVSIVCNEQLPLPLQQAVKRL